MFLKGVGYLPPTPGGQGVGRNAFWKAAERDSAPTVRIVDWMRGVRQKVGQNISSG